MSRFPAARPLNPRTGRADSDPYVVGSLSGPAAQCDSNGDRQPENQGLADEAVQDLEASGFPGSDVRLLREPLDMGATGLMGTPRTDFQDDLRRDLRTMGATQQEAEAYVQGVRRGAVLIFASGADGDKIDAAAAVMNRHSPVEVDEITGGDVQLPREIGEGTTSVHHDSAQAGRVRYPGGGGTRVFVW